MLLLCSLMRRKCFKMKTVTEVKNLVYEKENTSVNSGMFFVQLIRNKKQVAFLYLEVLGSENIFTDKL